MKELDPEALDRRRAQRRKWSSTPASKELQKEYNKNKYNKLRNDPVAWAEYKEKQRLRMAARLADPEARRKENARQKEYTQKRIETDPDFHQAVKTRNNKYYQKVKNTPGYKKNLKASAKTQYRRIKSDPEKYEVFKAEARVRVAARYKTILTNPKLHEEYLVKRREMYRKRMERKRKEIIEKT